MAEVRIVEGTVEIGVEDAKGKEETHDYVTLEEMGDDVQVRVNGDAKFWCYSGKEKYYIDNEPDLKP